VEFDLKDAGKISSGVWFLSYNQITSFLSELRFDRNTAMQKSIFKNWSLIDLLLPLLVLALMTVFTYGALFQAPYAGFYFNPNTGEVLQLSVQAVPSAALQVGDMLDQIGPVSWQGFSTDRNQVLFVGVLPNQVVNIVVKRDGQSLTIPWVFPGFNRPEFIGRIFNIWWLGYIFWFFGMLVQLVMRPKDARWRLLIAANYLTGLWLVVGTLSSWHTWGSSLLLHMLTWVALPVYLRLHWLFPKPLGRMPVWGWVLLWLVSALLALGELFQLLPRSLYSVGFFLMLAASVVLLLLHFFRQPEQRREVSVLLVSILVAVVPAAILGVAVGVFGSTPAIGPLGLVALPIMPAAYFYSVYRRQLGGLELRANRILSVYAFLILLVTLLIPVVLPFFRSPSISSEIAIFITVTIAALTAWASILIFPVFQAFVDQRIFGIKLPYENLQETYSARIVTSTSLASLERLLKDEVLPSLMVRQFVFLRLQNGAPQLLLTVGIAEAEVPTGPEFSGLLPEMGKYRPPESGQPAAWVLLALPLKVGENIIAFWLLGRRDPDDIYLQAEIPVLQSLADQTAMALSNILHAERLRAMYQTDINRYEQERLRLARELHDNVLNEMAYLLMDPDSQHLPPGFLQGYSQLTQRVRDIASDLRPPMLDYGLKPAFVELADNLMERTKDTVSIRVELQADDDCRYAEHIEQHLFRIFQQGCENALRHGRARNICISGKLDAAGIDLGLEDDGVGFDTASRLELNALLAGKHFGLVGMHERAELIGAELQINSAVSAGTRIRVTWSARLTEIDQDDARIPSP
jgi:signal transduction histidine kinase